MEGIDSIRLEFESAIKSLTVIRAFDMEWAHYLSRGVQEPVFHMCDAKEFALATVDGGFYYSPTFKDDKFIHATADPQHLLEAGNHFYKVFGIRCLEYDAICVRNLGWIVYV